MRSKFHMATSILMLLLAIGGSGIAGFAIKERVQIVRVISDSMAPQFHRGDALIFKAIPVEQIKIDEILLLPVPDGSGGSYVHRIIAMEVNEKNQVTVQTKGDANPMNDRWKLTIKSPTAPAYLGKIPLRLIPIINFESWLIVIVMMFATVLIILPFLRKRPERGGNL